VRITPVNEGDRTVKKISSDTLSVGERKFIFDSVIDSNANQVCYLILVFLFNIYIAFNVE
jgi:hypothetical protein